MPSRSHIPFVILCIFLTRSASSVVSQGDLIDAEIQKTNKNADWCWERGGIPVSTCRDCQEELLRGGRVKLVKEANDSLTVLNYGYPFISKKDGGCVVVHEYNCLQDVVIGTESDYDRFEQLECKQLHGDLIFVNFKFDSTNTYSALESLERIVGKLIIHNTVGNIALNFRNLASIKSKERHVNEQSVQITRNRLSSIHFPKLISNENQSFILGENFVFSNQTRILPIVFEETQLKRVVRANPPSRQKKTRKFPKKLPPSQNEQWFISQNISYKVINMYRIELCPEYTCDTSTFVLQYSIPSYFIFALSIAMALYFWRFHAPKDNFDFDLDAPPDVEAAPGSGTPIATATGTATGSASGTATADVK